MSGEPEVLYSVTGHVATLTINRPERRNAITEGVIAGIGEGIGRAAEDADIRVVVLTGAGDRAFCAGADLAGGTARFGLDPNRSSHPFADLLRAAHACPQPLVARVNGACMAGGMGLLAMCDMAVAADHASFGLPEVKVGVFPMQVLAALMPLVPPRDLAELCFTGEPVDAEAAARMRLVNHVVPAAELDAKTQWLVGRIIDKSPAAIRRGRHAMNAVSAMNFEQALSFLEGQIGLVAQTEDAREGIAAFNEKRKPQWTGR
jgi:methylglutaconyl-CoA hydratase